ncbi:MAG: tRNA (adenosine(37)-N6)-threonylcarbamoyltransferase complex transferase subunit TsaD [Bacteroidota bacterium]|nr:tRNA (adenosine(37)-N6)-threonylcarbamoyltransferase complex transferase subunit TsaD [Bacteroidota bacterium]
MTTLLAIESSCDDTGAAVIEYDLVQANVVNTQKIHELYGGVVPELASRAHISHIIPVVHTALAQSGKQLSDINAIACTQGPGLMGSLLVGWSFSRALSQALGIPLIGVNHLQAHLTAHFMNNEELKLPMISLLVSGGHTMLVLIKSPTQYEILGKTQDDAAGEAFDKAAKILELPYPGGPMIDKIAKDGGDIKRFKFPTANMPGFDFSFSGMKTAFLYFIRDGIAVNQNFVADNLVDICASWQHHVVTYLLGVMAKAISEHEVIHIGICGGVAANSHLRSELSRLSKDLNVSYHIPEMQYCTDNAGMIAKAGMFKYNLRQFTNINDVPYTKHILY